MSGFLDNRTIQFKDTGIFLTKYILNKNHLVLMNSIYKFSKIYALRLNEKKDEMHMLYDYKEELHKMSIVGVEGIVLEEIFQWLLENTMEFHDEEDLR
jgi:hypothetical protein